MDVTTTNETSHGVIRSAAAVTQEPQQGAGRGDAPPTPPPPPPASDGSNLDWRAQRDQQRSQSKRLKAQRRAEWLTRLRAVDRQYFVWGGVIVGLGVAYFGATRLLAMQRDTNIALAQIAAGAPVEQPAAQPTVVQGMPNPLQPLPLSSEAIWILGAEYVTNDAGEATGFTDLPPNRSAAVMSQIMQSVDLCDVYVSLGQTAEVVVTFEPTPGAYPMIEPGSDMCAAPLTAPTKPTLQPVPTDPIPTTVPAS